MSTGGGDASVNDKINMGLGGAEGVNQSPQKKSIHPFFLKKKEEQDEPVHEPPQITATHEPPVTDSRPAVIHPFFMSPAERQKKLEQEKREEAERKRKEEESRKVVATTKRATEVYIDVEKEPWRDESKSIHPFFTQRERPQLAVEEGSLHVNVYVPPPEFKEAPWPGSVGCSHVRQLDEDIILVNETYLNSQRTKGKASSFEVPSISEKLREYLHDWSSGRSRGEDLLSTSQSTSTSKGFRKLPLAVVKWYLETIYTKDQLESKGCRHLLDLVLAESGSQPQYSLPWTQVYRPQHSDHVLGNREQTEYLRRWLKEWLLTPSIITRTDEDQSGFSLTPQLSPSNSAPPVIPEKRKKKPGRKRRRKDGLDSFIVSTDEENSDWQPGGLADLFSLSDDDFQTPLRGSLSPLNKRPHMPRKRPEFVTSNLILIVGPTGCGKTTAVYACAEELGYEVFEVNAASRRSGRDLLMMVGEMTQSHLVGWDKIVLGMPESENGASTPEETMVDLTESASNSPADHVGMERGRGRPRVKKAGLGTSIPERGGEVEDICIEARQDQGGAALAAKPRQSLILLEEVDVMYEEDRSFWSSVVSLALKSRRPIIMTCQDAFPIPMGNLHLQRVLRFTAPPVHEVSPYLHLMCLLEAYWVDPTHLENLYLWLRQDLRRTIFQIEILARSSGERVGDLSIGGMEVEEDSSDIHRLLRELKRCEKFYNQASQLEFDWGENTHFNIVRRFRDVDLSIMSELGMKKCGDDINWVSLLRASEKWVSFNEDAVESLYLRRWERFLEEWFSSTGSRAIDFFTSQKAGYLGESNGASDEEDKLQSESELGAPQRKKERHLKELAMLRNRARYLENVSLLDARIGVSKRRLVEIQEGDQYDSSTDDLVGYTSIFKDINSAGREHWSFEQEVEAFASILSQLQSGEESTGMLPSGMDWGVELVEKCRGGLESIRQSTYSSLLRTLTTTTELLRESWQQRSACNTRSPDLLECRSYLHTILAIQDAKAIAKANGLGEGRRTRNTLYRPQVEVGEQARRILESGYWRG
ncbi:uncharacterized protein VTP21DRAFT_213 [Calcarisporiella thermophila]|uniref:uncharacterized protein n=1 Tax=Calcarisporiella thermophila TaxID=911321 RepID=UPI003743EB56